MRLFLLAFSLLAVIFGDSLVTATTDAVTTSIGTATGVSVTSFAATTAFSAATLDDTGELSFFLPGEYKK